VAIMFRDIPARGRGRRHRMVGNVPVGPGGRAPGYPATAPGLSAGRAGRREGPGWCAVDTDAAGLAAQTQRVAQLEAIVQDLGERLTQGAEAEAIIRGGVPAAMMRASERRPMRPYAIGEAGRDGAKRPPVASWRAFCCLSRRCQPGGPYGLWLCVQVLARRGPTGPAEQAAGCNRAGPTRGRWPGPDR
jgi:hypothetical protein